MIKYPNSIFQICTSLKEFLNLQFVKLLPDQDIMIKNHLNLISYLEMEDPLFILRKFKHHSNRGSIYSLENDSFTVSDNEPALWVFMESYCKSELNFQYIIKNQLFPIAFAIKEEEKQGCIWQTIGRKHKDFSDNGWKHCHIFQCAPSGESVDNKNDLKRRTLRLLSPLNHFPFFSPRKFTMPIDYGENKECIEYIIWWLYNNFYTDKNKSFFKAFVEGQNFNIPIEEPKDIKIDYSIKNLNESDVKILKIKKDSETLDVKSFNKLDLTQIKHFEYNSTRLSFKKKIIDEMNDRDILIINVVNKQIPDNNGRFKFSKSQIYQTFDNVIKTKSYQDDGNFNYKITPSKANKYRIDYLNK